jgi:hypothetical protein
VSEYSALGDQKDHRSALVGSALQWKKKRLRNEHRSTMTDNKQPSVKSTEPTTKSTEPSKQTTQPPKTQEDKDIENQSKSWGDRIKDLLKTR